MKKIKTLINLLKRFFIDWREFSFSVAFGRFFLDLPVGSWNNRNRYYMNCILRYLKRDYTAVIKQCMRNYDDRQCIPCKEKQIWVMWWQGIEGMPPLVKACYDRLLSVADGCTITLITKDNYMSYLSLPESILQKVEHGNISLTHLSDIIRVILLKDYGGIWFDATIYAETLPSYIFSQEFYTLRAPGFFPYFVHNGEWSTFLFSVQKRNAFIFYALVVLFTEYWSKHSYPIDYLLFDYFIRLLIETDNDSQTVFEKCPENRDYYSLNLSINDVFSSDRFNEMMKQSPLQKLTYKKEMFELDENGNPTNYHFLLSRK